MAVEGSTCINPVAPARLTARGLPELSTWIIAWVKESRVGAARVGAIGVGVAGVAGAAGAAGAP